MPGVRRVIVGTSGSPGSLRALRDAEDLARAHNATLIPVLSWVPPGGDLAGRRHPSGYLRRIWKDDACRRLRDALNAAWGEIPGDPPVQPVVQRGEAGLVLVNLACCPGDLLVVGAGRRGPLARLVSGKVSRYCLAHAGCPVIAVPPPALAREVRHGRSGGRCGTGPSPRTGSSGTRAGQPHRSRGARKDRVASRKRAIVDSPPFLPDDNLGCHSQWRQLGCRHGVQ